MKLIMISHKIVANNKKNGTKNDISNKITLKMLPIELLCFLIYHW